MYFIIVFSVLYILNVFNVFNVLNIFNEYNIYRNTKYFNIDLFFDELINKYVNIKKNLL